MSLGPAIPTLRVADMGRSVTYYNSTLGFDVKWHWSEATQFEGELAAASLVCVESGEAVLFLSAEGGGQESSLFFEYAWVEDLDEFAAGIEDARCQDEPWGSREFRVCDPDGHVLRFSCPSNRRRSNR